MRIKKEVKDFVSLSLFVVLLLMGCSSAGTHLDKEAGHGEGGFVTYGKGIVYDRSTGLEWIAGPDEDTIFDKAEMWAENLDVENGGWRLPTADELRTLYDPGKGDRNITPLLKITGWHVWTSENDSQWRYFFSFVTGSVQREANSDYYAGNGDSKRTLAVRLNVDKKLEILDNKYAGFVKHAATGMVNKMGVEQAKKGDFYSAIWFFNKAIQKDPSNYQAYFNRGYCFEEQKDYRKAVDDFSKAIDLNPNFSSAYAHRGLIFSVANAYDQAIEDLDMAIKTDPGNGLAYESKAIMLYRLGRYEDSWGNVKKAQELKHQVSPALIRALNLHVNAD